MGKYVNVPETKVGEHAREEHWKKTDDSATQKIVQDLDRQLNAARDDLREAIRCMDSVPAAAWGLFEARRLVIAVYRSLGGDEDDVS